MCGLQVGLNVLPATQFTGDSETHDTDSVPGSGRSPGEGNGNPLQDLCLGNCMDRGTLQAISHGVTKESDTTLANT